MTGKEGPNHFDEVEKFEQNGPVSESSDCSLWMVEDEFADTCGPFYSKREVEDFLQELIEEGQTEVTVIGYAPTETKTRILEENAQLQPPSNHD